MNSAHDAPAVDERRILFIGDSITDCGRREDPEEHGFGYVRLIAEHFAAHDPSARVINRGVGGDRARDLVPRFKDDCLDGDSAEVTIYIGVNDSWHRDEQGLPTGQQDFERDVRYLLDQLSATRPAVPVTLILPFVTPVNPEIALLQEDLDAKREVLRRLAREFSCTVVDAQELIDEAQQHAGHTPQSLAEDGVHPTIAGHRLLADAWLASRQARG